MVHYRFSTEYRCAFCEGLNPDLTLTLLEVVGNCNVFVCNVCDHHTIMQKDPSAFPWKYCLVIFALMVFFALWLVS